MKTCNNCGATVEDGTKFCSKCGASVEADESAFTKQDTDNASGCDENNIRRQGYHYDQTGTANAYQSAASTDPFAIVAFVLSLAGIILSWFTLGVPSIIGLIFGILAMSRCKKEEKGGYGMALASVIIAAIILAIYFILMAIGLAMISSAIGNLGHMSFYF